MRQADFKARIKKIEIANRTLTDGWAQAIRVLLDDIELTDENLLELKQFRPNEPVTVQINPVQVSLLDKPPAAAKAEDSLDEPEDGGLFQFIEGEPEDLPPEAVAKEWNFG
ncbi:hypothetical protein Desca_1647 [Desulfotomaculum nigrificans CO-1-SRB]|uniref:Uncharacterized protein n=1 Tax=Desulfotomaculum nigrificans (strain DSM 14880 / VKM B-2319 / CO-1-SRB) TaxID=868595 RepID=F6B770_DESCC|nr:hypothetical protein [Desulfotomaculum nigrificans]AEF94495.1 hypothetical protein Desca_1647 [Desulfotomaculum nigrificans CO-1-SRB]